MADHYAEPGRQANEHMAKTGLMGGMGDILRELAASGAVRHFFPRKMRLACLEDEEMIHLYRYDRFRSAMRRPGRG